MYLLVCASFRSFFLGGGDLEDSRGVYESVVWHAKKISVYGGVDHLLNDGV